MENQNLAIDRCMEVQHHLALGKQTAQTIDLHSLFAYEAGKSGVFDLSDIASTSLGKLLDAIPVPVLLITSGSASLLSTRRAKSSASIPKA